MKSVVIFAFAFAAFFAVTSGAPQKPNSFSKLMPLLLRRSQSTSKASPSSYKFDLSNAKNILTKNFIEQAIESTRKFETSAATFAFGRHEVNEIDRNENGGRASSFYYDVELDVLVSIWGAYFDFFYYSQTDEEGRETAEYAVTRIEQVLQTAYDEFPEGDLINGLIIMTYMYQGVVHFEETTEAIGKLWALIHPDSEHKFNQVQTSVSQLMQTIEYMALNPRQAKGLIEKMHAQSVETLFGSLLALKTFLNDFHNFTEWCLERFDSEEFYEGMLDHFSAHYNLMDEVQSAPESEIDGLVTKTLERHQATWNDLFRKISNGEISWIMTIILGEYAGILLKYFYLVTEATEPWSRLLLENW